MTRHRIIRALLRRQKNEHRTLGWQLFHVRVARCLPNRHRHFKGVKRSRVARRLIRRFRRYEAPPVDGWAGW